MEDFIVYIGISWVVRGGDEEEKDANTGCSINIPKVSERSELNLQLLSGQKLIKNDKTKTFKILKHF